MSAISLRVLLVEDSDADAKLVLHELRQAGFDPLVTRVENEAEYLARLNPLPDAILCDYNLPQFDALRALELLRKRGLNVPFLIVSGSIGEETAVEAIKRGATDYLLKDRLARLGPAVKQALDQQRLQASERQTQAAMQASEERFRTLIEQATDAIFLHNASDGKVVDVNRRACESLGYSRDELIGMDMQKFDPFITQEQLTWNIEELHAGRTVTLESRHLRKNGTSFPVEVRVGPIDLQGRPNNLAIVRDITDRKQAEQRLKAQHAVVSILAEATSLQEAAPRILQSVCETIGWDVGDLWLVDQDDSVLTCADIWSAKNTDIAPFRDHSHRITFERGAGLPGRVWASRQGMWIVDVTKDPNFPRGPSAARCGLHGGFGFPIHFGNEVFGVAEFFSRDSRQPDEELIRMFGSLGSQIGQFVERKRAEQLLQEAKQRLQYVIASSPAVLFTLKVEGDVIRGISWISNNIQAMLGHPPKAASDPNWWIDNIHPEDRDAVIARTHEQLFSRDRANNEYRFLHGNGEYRWTRGELLLIRDADGRSVEAVGSWSDITERKHLEDQFRQSQKMEAIGKLAGGIAHDFNNLLTVINGYCEILIEGLRPSDPLRETLETIRQAGVRAAGLTRQLLVFSRKAVLKPVVLDPNALLTDLERMLSRLIGEDIELTLAAAPGVWKIKVDPGQMEQVVMNLVVNARDAMSRGGKLTIETANVELDETYTSTHLETLPGSYVLIAVSDTGHGIDDLTKLRIFEPFFTTKGPEQGTGLGLAVVHGIVKQSGGWIVVYSELGLGTTFKIYLPRAEQEAPTNQPTVTVVPPRGNETILLVEDEDAVRLLAKFALDQHGYRVLAARNGGEALLLCRKTNEPIHIMITDIVMPGMSGWELAELLKIERPAMKILFLSGYTDDAVVRHGLITADTPFLQKPFTPNSLRQKVREVL